jgi:hypothetical protein
MEKYFIVLVFLAITISIATAADENPNRAKRQMTTWGGTVQ